jgi:hypothetical protein
VLSADSGGRKMGYRIAPVEVNPAESGFAEFRICNDNHHIRFRRRARSADRSRAYDQSD